MLNVAAAFGGGVYIRQALNDVKLPAFRRQQDSSATFKLSVRVIAAAAPALKEPGFWSRQRPFLQACLGDVEKDSEPADYVGKDAAAPSAGACAKECPWRFGDSLTFVANIKDVLGPGLRLKLRAHSDVNLGPLQLQLASTADLGEAAVDLRRRVLPACVRKDGAAVAMWESPLLLIPLLHVRGGVVAENHDIGQATAHVALVFSMNVDPESILECVNHEPRQVSEVLQSRAEKMIDWLEQPIQIPDIDSGYFPGSDILEAGGWFKGSTISNPEDDFSAVAAALSKEGGAMATMRPDEMREAEERARHRRGKVAAVEHALEGPDLAPDGWVSRKGPNGRLHWHHKALGPAPWEAEDRGDLCASTPSPARSLAPLPSGQAGDHGAAADPDERPPIVSPELSADGWISHRGKDGRLFWHHTSLGPPPWQRMTV
eukprot:TRINITY_DN66508_c0_g1_i1.p1 TRINITY_DN66508_c0_g1~~TRINITY_DN66508_c0_g1_i1.p1  ORF type:complete len:431 (+),score=101.24 TRINITY_DN66508_c0_g1_i1:216-1508(+)